MLKFIDQVFDCEEARQTRSLFVIELLQVTLLRGFAHFDSGTHFELVVLDLMEGKATIGDCVFSLRIDLGEDCACRCRGCGEYDGALCSGGYCCI